MRSISALSPFEPETEDWCPREYSGLAKRLFDAGMFVQRLGVQMRFGELTRAPLHLLRFQMNECVAECDWQARLPDPWDEGLQPEFGHRHASLQALKDAVDVRALLFSLLPDVDSAYLRIYRRRTGHGRDLVIAGHVQRIAPAFRNVHSISMRAKLLGFRFSLESEILRGMREMTNLELVDW